MVVPESLREIIKKELHREHLGISKTKGLSGGLALTEIWKSS